MQASHAGGEQTPQTLGMLQSASTTLKGERSTSLCSIVPSIALPRSSCITRISPSLTAKTAGKSLFSKSRRSAPTSHMGQHPLSILVLANVRSWRKPLGSRFPCVITLPAMYAKTTHFQPNLEYMSLSSVLYLSSSACCVISPRHKSVRAQMYVNAAMSFLRIIVATTLASDHNGTMRRASAQSESQGRHWPMLILGQPYSTILIAYGIGSIMNFSTTVRLCAAAGALV